MSILSTQILVSEYKEPGLMGEMLDSRTGAGKVHGDLEYLGSNKLWKCSRNEGDISKGHRGQIEKATIDQL